MLRTIGIATGSLVFASTAVGADGSDTIGYPSVEAALDALRADPTAQFETQQGWTVVASRAGGDPVQWFFTPAGHPAHPAVVKRTAVETSDLGFIDLAALCYGPESECYRLIDDFRQRSEQAIRDAQPQRVVLDVGIALNDHERVRVHRLLAEEGKAAEIRMDDVLKIVIVPTVDEERGVLLWTAVYEFDGAGYRLLAEPRMTAPGDGTAEILMAAGSGSTFRFAITPALAARGAEGP
jgi:hypothetical protein